MLKFYNFVIFNCLLNVFISIKKVFVFLFVINLFLIVFFLEILNFDFNIKIPEIIIIKSIYHDY